MNEKTVRLFHKADWIDINFAIRSTMTKTTLNKMTITKYEIDNYVDTPTNTITSAIAEKVPAKCIKRNSIGLPIEIKELIRILLIIFIPNRLTILYYFSFIST